MNGKCESHFLTKKNPRKFHWTTFYRRLHKKGTSEEVAKRKVRRTTKFQRAVVGATWDEIVAKRNQPMAVRIANRDAAVEAAKQKKRDAENLRRKEKVKAVSAGQRLASSQQAKTAAAGKSSKPAKSRF